MFCLTIMANLLEGRDAKPRVYPLETGHDSRAAEPGFIFFTDIIVKFVNLEVKGKKLINTKSKSSGRYWRRLKYITALAGNRI